MVSLRGKFEQERRKEGGGRCGAACADGRGQLPDERDSVVGMSSSAQLMSFLCADMVQVCLLRSSVENGLALVAFLFA